ncbi:MAG TPA: cobyric acid synthase [Thermoanaerobaculia bacterium]|jgi:adenosylcobyric acid synthase
MVLGTASHVGKSVTTAALCRIFSDDGIDVAPFKAQNMALNSFATPDGLEIGRAQAVQAAAARIAPHTDMNPILLKPVADTESQVILHGRILATLSGQELFARRLELFHEVRKAYDRLAARHELIVLEGAGSPVEINLKHLDMVNLNMAEHADAKCILVADIDRGGVFAQIVGTYALLEPDERERFRGFVINRFRGDPKLLGDAVSYLEHRTGQPCLGVVPNLRDLGIEEEDTLVIPRSSAAPDALKVGVVLLRSLSNFTDFDPLTRIDGVSLSYVRNAAEIAGLDVVILPGSKSTMRDLEDLRARGVAAAVLTHARAGKPVIGICGGLQMLGRTIEDPYGVETAGTTEGLGLLDIETSMTTVKTTRQVRGSFANTRRLGDATVGGYEIHVGETRRGDVDPLFILTRTGSGEVVEDGAIRDDGRILGTYVHGLFDEPACAMAVLNHLRALTGHPPFDAGAVRPQPDPYARLAAHFREHLDVDALYAAVGVMRQPA